MEISVKGKQIDIGAALQSHVTDHLNASVLKYFERALDANVILSKESHAFRADISVHPSRGMTVQGKAVADDAYAAFDSALARIAKQLRRYKRRLQDHHKGRPEEDLLTAQYSILASDDTEDELPVDGEPAIIADMPHEIATLTVGEAVMRLDLADAPAMMFKNSANGSFNVVYRRADGNIGWIDPSNTQNV